MPASIRSALSLPMSAVNPRSESSNLEDTPDDADRIAQLHRLTRPQAGSCPAGPCGPPRSPAPAWSRCRACPVCRRWRSLIVNGWLLLTSAISAYESPCANSVSISLSRSVSRSSSLARLCSAAALMPANTLLMTAPGIRYSPSATSLIVVSSLSLPEYFWRYPVAPAATASITASSSADAVRMSTLVSGSISVISRQASIPFLERHHDIHDDHVRSELLRDSYGRRAVSGLSDHVEVALPLEHLPQAVSHYLMIVDEQYPCLFFCRGRHFAGLLGVLYLKGGVIGWYSCSSPSPQPSPSRERGLMCHTELCRSRSCHGRTRSR